MSKIFKSYKKESKENYGQYLEPDENISVEQIKLGSLLRIADALEVMAVNYHQLINERDRYKNYYESEREIRKKFEHRIAGLRGYIKRIKRKNRR